MAQRKAWHNSTRSSRLPRKGDTYTDPETGETGTYDSWNAITKRIKERAGGQCEKIDWITGKRCEVPGKEVDHKVTGDDHRDKNLQLLCKGHHQEKTLRENAVRRVGGGVRIKKQEKNYLERGIITPTAMPTKEKS